MKKYTGIFTLVTIIFMVLMFSPILTKSALAATNETTMVHGSSGHIEYLDRVDNTDIYKGWGLDFVQSSGLLNWVHYSIPIQYGSKVRYIGIQFKTGSIDVSILDFHVYCGAGKIYDSPDMNLTSTDDTYVNGYYVIDMGAWHEMTSALGLCILVGAGVESMSHWIKIFAVGTLFIVD